MDTTALREAFEGTERAGWLLPLCLHRSTFQHTREAWDIDEDDGTRVAIVAEAADARFISEAITFALSVLAWPPEATATPPEYPFKLDRHVYGEPASAWRKRAGLA